MKVPFLIGRLAFGGFFLYNGLNHLLKREQVTPYVASKKVPMPGAAVTVSGIALILGGASILLGVKPKIGAAGLAAFLASITPIMHDYWNAPSEQQMGEMVHFTKNLGLLGAALALMGMEEPWPVSVPVDQPSRLERVARFTKQLAA
jgi:putative oxidoreductase